MTSLSEKRKYILGIYDEAKGLACLAEYILFQNGQDAQKAYIKKVWSQAGREPKLFGEVLEQIAREVYEECGGDPARIAAKIRKQLPHYAANADNISVKMRNSWHLPIKREEEHVAIASAATVRKAGIKVRGKLFGTIPETLS
jgi:hypothetical protein